MTDRWILEERLDEPVTTTGIKIPVVKRYNRDTLHLKRDRILKRIGDIQSELGRMNRILDELRADVLHLDVE